MRTARIAFYSLLGIVIVLVLAVIVVVSIDLGRYKNSVEGLVSDALNREFRIEGTFAPSLGPTIRLFAESIHLAGTDWSAAEDLLYVERLEVSVDAWSLISGPVVIEELAVAGIRINLEELEDGRKNWALASEEAPEDETEDAERERLEELPLIVNELQVDDFALALVSPSLRRPLNVSLEKIRENTLETGDVELDISGHVNDTPVSLAAVAGKRENLMSLREVVLKFEGALGEISFNGDAAIDDLLAPSRPTGELALRGPNAEYLTDVLGLDPISTGPLNLDMSITPAAERMNITARGVFGEFALDASGSLVDLRTWSDMEVRAVASGPDAATVGRLLGRDTVPEDPFRIDATAKIAGRHIQIDKVEVEIGETRFDAHGSFANFPKPDDASLTLHVSGPDFGRFNRLLGMPGKLTGPFNLDLLVQSTPDENASVKLTAAASDLTLAIDAVVVNAPDFLGTTFNASGNGPNFSVIAAAAGLAHAPADPFEVHVSAERTGNGIAVSASQVKIGRDQLNVAGLIGNQPLQADTDLRLQASGPDLVATLTDFGLDSKRQESSNWSIDGRIYRSEDLFLVENLRAAVGADRVTLNGKIGNQPLIRDSDVTFDLSAKDFRETLSVFGIDDEAIPAGTLKASGRVRARDRALDLAGVTVNLAGANLRVDGALGELPSLNGTNLNVTASGSDLSKLVIAESPPVVLDKPFQLGANARVNRDLLKVTDLEFRLDQSRLDGQLDVQLRPMVASGRFVINAEVPNLLSLAPRSGEIVEMDTVPLKLQSRGEWKEGIWTIGDISMLIGQGSLKVKGTIDQPPDVDRTDLTFDWTIGSMRNFSLLAGYELPDHPAQVQFHLTGNRDTMSIDNFRGQIGDSDLTGALALQHGERPRLETAFKSNRLNIAAYLPPVDESPGPKPAEPAGGGQRFIPDTPIPVERLNEIDASVDVEIGELVLRNRSLHDVILWATLKDGVLDLPSVRMKNDTGGMLTGLAQLRPVAAGADMLIDVQGSGLNGGFLNESREDVAMLPKFDLDTVLVGSGATYAGLAGSLNGYMRATGGEGRVRSSALRYFTSDFLTEVINTVNPFTATDPYTNVKCYALLLRFDDGMVSGKPAIVAQSDKIQVFVNLDVDLKSEHINADIKTVPQKGLGVSVSDLVNPYIKVDGTLAHPTLVLDPKGVLIEGGAAVATAGLSILAMSIKDRFLSPKDQCGKAIEEAAGDFEQIRKKYRPEPPQ